MGNEPEETVDWGMVMIGAVFVLVLIATIVNSVKTKELQQYKFLDTCRASGRSDADCKFMWKEMENN